MVQTFTGIGDSKVHYCSGFNATDGLTTKEYSELLNNSKFVLCPPGQDSMDSFRIYEALEAGGIPVVLNRTERLPIHPSYWKAIFMEEGDLPFIQGDSWEECKDKLIRVIEANETNEKQTKCKELWVKWKNIWAEEMRKKIKLLESA